MQFLCLIQIQMYTSIHTLFPFLRRALLEAVRGQNLHTNCTVQLKLDDHGAVK